MNDLGIKWPPTTSSHSDTLTMSLAQMIEQAKRDTIARTGVPAFYLHDQAYIDFGHRIDPDMAKACGVTFPTDQDETK